jgi:hypothetical protein
VAGRDHEQADREADARRRLLEAGAADLPRAPWLASGQPPAAAELIRFATWRAARGEMGRDDLLAALTLVDPARAEADQAEAALLFLARGHGLTWAQISRALGLRSPQAAQQRFGRVADRATEGGTP